MTSRNRTPGVRLSTVYSVRGTQYRRPGNEGGKSAGGFAVGLRRAVLGDERQLPGAEGDLVPGPQLGRAGDLLAVEDGAVLRRDVVDLAPPVVVDDHRAVPAGDVLVLDDHVVVGEPADAVDAEGERVEGVAVPDEE